MTRSELRESVFIILFEKNFNRDLPVEELMITAAETEIPVSDETERIAKAVLEHEEEINEYIVKYSKKRAFHRIAALNRVILQIAIYEALYEESVPLNVAVSEAVNLARKYTFDEDISFINGLLGEFGRNEIGKA
jgi:N utilization substance protein B